MGFWKSEEPRFSHLQEMGYGEIKVRSEEIKEGLEAAVLRVGKNNGFWRRCKRCLDLASGQGASLLALKALTGPNCQFETTDLDVRIHPSVVREIGEHRLSQRSELIAETIQRAADEGKMFDAIVIYDTYVRDVCYGLSDPSLFARIVTKDGIILEAIAEGMEEGWLDDTLGPHFQRFEKDNAVFHGVWTKKPV